LEVSVSNRFGNVESQNVNELMNQRTNTTNRHNEPQYPLTEITITFVAIWFGSKKVKLVTYSVRAFESELTPDFRQSTIQVTSDKSCR